MAKASLRERYAEILRLRALILQAQIEALKYGR